MRNISKYSCLKYEANSAGKSIAVQKNHTDCNRLGPVTAGFNQAACGTSSRCDMCFDVAYLCVVSMMCVDKMCATSSRQNFLLCLPMPQIFSMDNGVRTLEAVEL